MKLEQIHVTETKDRYSLIKQVQTQAGWFVIMD